MQPEIIPPSQTTYSRKKIIWGIVCLVGPIGLIIASLLLYAIVNFITGDSGDSVIRTIMNVFLFIVGAFSVMSIVPGFIIGIILLATAKK